MYLLFVLCVAPCRRILALFLPAGHKGRAVAHEAGLVKVVVAVRLDEVVSLAKVLQTDGALAVRDVPFRQAVLGHLTKENYVIPHAQQK